jgi:hypothetical protein
MDAFLSDYLLEKSRPKQVLMSDRCMHEKHHVNGQAESLVASPDFKEDILVPCPYCRRQDFADKWKEVLVSYENLQTGDPVADAQTLNGKTGSILKSVPATRKEI